MKNLLIVLVVLIVCAPAFVFAQEPVLTTLPEPEPSGFEYPTLSFGNVSIASQTGNEVKVMYQVGSTEGIVPEAHITLALRTMNENSALTIVDEQVIVSGLTLGPENSPIMSAATYTIPPYLSGTYELIMLSRAQNGRINTFARAGEVTAVASVPLATTCTLNGQATTERPTITLGESITLSCLLKNTGTESMTLEPSFLTKLRSAQGNPVATGDYPATPITVGAGEEQTVTLEVPKVSQPESYAVVATFTDTTTNTVAGAVPFSYLVEGPRAHFIDITFDRIPVAEGDTMNVYATWSIVGASLYPATLQASIGDATGVCSNFVNERVTANTNTLTVPLTLARPCPDGKLSVSLVQTDVKTLATATYALALNPAAPAETSEAQPTTEVPTTPTPKNNVPMLVSFLLLLLVVAVVGYLMSRKKTPTPTATTLSIVFFALVVFAGTIQNAEAGSVSFDYEHNFSDPRVCGTCEPVGMLYYVASIPNQVAPGSVVTIDITGSAVEPLYQVPICPTIRYGGNGSGSMGSYQSLGCWGKSEFINTSKTFTAPSTPGTYQFCAAAGMNDTVYVPQSGTQCTSYTVQSNTCSFSGTLNWFAGDGSQCSVGATYSNVSVGQTRTAYDSDASGNTFTGSITYRCDAGGWAYVTADCTPNYSCQGGMPANSTPYDPEESTGLSNNSTSWTHSLTDTATKCQYACNIGYEWVGGSCQLISYACQGSIPANASEWDSEESSGLSNNSTWWSHASSDTGTKCQYRCGSGYTYSAGSCVPDVTAACGPAEKTYAYTDSSYTGAFCGPGNSVSPLSPSFPAQGGNSSWTCYGTNDSDICTAWRDSAPTFSCTGADPANATLCSGDNTGLSANTAKTVVNSCTAGTKCEFTCGSGYTNSGGTCVATTACADGIDNDGDGLTDMSDPGCSGSSDNDESNSFSCTGADPANATLCSGDNTGLSANTAKTVVNSCTAGTKCEFTCGSGYTKVGSSCVAACADGIDNDGDGLVDMADSGCSGPGDVDESNSFSCTGADPANATLCSGDNTGLSANTAKTVVNSCTAGTKCEFTCGSGYTNSGGTCVATSGYPDLSAAPPTLSTGSVQQNGTINFTGTITNIGSATAGTYSNGVFYIDADGDGSHEYTASASAVTNTTAAGDSRTTTGGWTVPATAPIGSNYRVGYYADVNNNVNEGAGDGPWANWSGWSASFSVTSAAAFSCTGADPANATLCSGDNTGLSANTAKAVVNSCTAGTKCEFTCGSGYTNSGGTCVVLSNTAPLVNAGSNRVITLPTDMVTINDASASDPDGNTITILWGNTGRPAGAPVPGIVNGDTVTPTFFGLTHPGVYTFRMIVTDGIAPVQGTMTVTVYSAHPSISADPQVIRGTSGTTDLIWDTGGNPPETCSITGPGVNLVKGTLSSQSGTHPNVLVSARSTYTISCGVAPVVSDSVTVEIRPKANET